MMDAIAQFLLYMAVAGAGIFIGVILVFYLFWRADQKFEQALKEIDPKDLP